MKPIKQFVLNILSNTNLKFFIGIVLTNLFKKQQAQERDLSILIAAPGGGNIGDQAMLESFLKNIDGPKLIIKTNNNALSIPEQYNNNVDEVEMKGLVYGWVLPFITDFFRYLKLLASARALYVVGADVMDGGYNKNASAMRAYVALFASQQNVRSKIFGFSWNAKPHAMALAAIKKAGDAGVTLCARDPISFQRLETAGVKNVVQVADMVFANTNTLEAGVEDIKNFCLNKKVAIVNASGLITKEIDQLGEYKTIIDALLNKGFEIVLLPHVIRKGANDMEICKKIADEYPQLHFVDRLLSPDQVKSVVALARLVVTGRMHLSIMSMNALTPAIVLSTQGKVDGLMAYFETPEFSIDPVKGFGMKIASTIDTLDENYDRYKSKLINNIDTVRKLSAKNFSINDIPLP